MPPLERVPDPGAPPALRFAPVEPPAAPAPAAVVEWVPEDALVLWQHERVDLYRRMLALVVGNRLLLVLVSAGHETGMRIVAEAPVVDGPGVARPQVVRRDALVFWGETLPGRRGVTRTFVLRFDARLVMVRVTGDETAPAVEVLHTLDLAR